MVCLIASFFIVRSIISDGLLSFLMYSMQALMWRWQLLQMDAMWSVIVLAMLSIIVVPWWWWVLISQAIQIQTLTSQQLNQWPTTQTNSMLMVKVIMEDRISAYLSLISLEWELHRERIWSTIKPLFEFMEREGRSLTVHVQVSQKQEEKNRK